MQGSAISPHAWRPFTRPGTRKHDSRQRSFSPSFNPSNTNYYLTTSQLPLILSRYFIFVSSAACSLGNKWRRRQKFNFRTSKPPRVNRELSRAVHDYFSFIAAFLSYKYISFQPVVLIGQLGPDDRKTPDGSELRWRRCSAVVRLLLLISPLELSSKGFIFVFLEFLFIICAVEKISAVIESDIVYLGKGGKACQSLK